MFRFLERIFNPLRPSSDWHDVLQLAMEQRRLEEKLSVAKKDSAKAVRVLVFGEETEEIQWVGTGNSSRSLCVNVCVRLV